MHGHKTLLVHNIAGIFQHTQPGCSHRTPRKQEQWRLARRRLNQSPLRCALVSQTYISRFGKPNFLCKQLGEDYLSGQTPEKPRSCSGPKSGRVRWFLPSPLSLRQSLTIPGCA